MKLAGKVAVVMVQVPVSGSRLRDFLHPKVLRLLWSTVIWPPRTPPCDLREMWGTKRRSKRMPAPFKGQFGRFDILVTAAGWSTGTSVPNTTFDSWKAVLRTNPTGTFLWARQAALAMQQVGGAIVFVGSQLAFAGGRSNAAYLASKGAVVSLARSMALGHAAEVIRVNVVVPGAIDSPLLARAFARAPDPEVARSRSIARHPLGRRGNPEEVARAIMFLASDDNTFTTGSCLMVDGGWLAA